MKNKRYFRRIGLVLFSGLLLFTGINAVQAHGGGQPQLVNQPVGAYQLTVWTQPEPPKAGLLHVTAAVFILQENGGDQAVLDANVQAIFQPPNDAQPQTVTLSREEALNKAYYETDIPLNTPGVWQITIQVSGPQGGGQAEFPLDVRRSFKIPWLWIGIGSIFLLLAWRRFHAGQSSQME